MPEPKFQANIICHLWDLEDEGIDDVLDRLKGEAGITGITVPVYCGPVEIFRMHPEVSPRTFRSDGGLQFQPRSEYYEGTRLKPVVAEWLKTRDPLAKVAEACEKRNLKLRARISDLCDKPLRAPKHYNECVIKDAFGEARPGLLCPSAPDFQGLTCYIVRDLTTRFSLDAVELDEPDFTGMIDQFSDDFYPIGTWLASSCFCESCHQTGNRQDTDIGAAARSARVHLERYFGGQPIPHSDGDFETSEEHINAFLDTDPILKSFADWRFQQMTTLIEQIRKACEARLVLNDFWTRFFSGTDPRSLAPYCDAVMESGDIVHTAEPVGADAESAGAEIINDAKGKWGIDEDKIELSMACALLEMQDSTSIVSSTHSAAKQGIRSVCIGDYTYTPLHRLDWIHQAVRYARREVG